MTTTNGVISQMEEQKDNYTRSSNATLPTNENRRFTFLDLYNLVIGYRKFTISILLISVTLSVLYCEIAPPSYKASTIITPVAETLTMRSELEQLAGSFSYEARESFSMNVNSNLAILESRQFIELFIQENEIIPTIFPNYWNKQKFKWIAFGEPSHEEVYKHFLKSMAIAKEGNLITFSLNLSDQELVAPITNKIITRVNDYIRNIVLEETKTNIIFLEQQLNNTNLVHLQSTFYNIVEKELERSMLANARQDYAFRVIDIAHKPEHQSYPKLLQAIISSLMLGFIFSLAIIFLHSFYIQVRRTSRQ